MKLVLASKNKKKLVEMQRILSDLGVEVVLQADIDIDVSDDKLIERLSGRRVCLSCGGTYHVSQLNGSMTCAKCGQELIQRADDKAETVLSRLTVYHAQTAPLIDFYTQRGLLKVVDGAQPMDECFAAILAALGEK